MKVRFDFSPSPKAGKNKDTSNFVEVLRVDVVAHAHVHLRGWVWSGLLQKVMLVDGINVRHFPPQTALSISLFFSTSTVPVGVFW